MGYPSPSRTLHGFHQFFLLVTSNSVHSTCKTCFKSAWFRIYRSKSNQKFSIYNDDIADRSKWVNSGFVCWRASSGLKSYLNASLQTSILCSHFFVFMFFYELCVLISGRFFLQKILPLRCSKLHHVNGDLLEFSTHITFNKLIKNRFIFICGTTFTKIAFNDILNSSLAKLNHYCTIRILKSIC